ncbi:MAG: DUF1338 domain-containing protein [Bacteroidales bacterium]|nr:DUF1338 domain-containing protein [Bacteroidales bacterium]
MELQEIYKRLWNDYTSQNPSVGKVYNLFLYEGETINHDHIAFRSFNDHRVNIDVIARPFVERGYEARGEYHFKRKKAYARHYEHKEDPSLPRIFISHLLTEQLSDYVQQTVERIMEKSPQDTFGSEELIFSKTLWGTPNYGVYQKLRDESEYAAWMYAFGFRVNHFAMKVNDFQQFTELERINNRLKNEGWVMNPSGGEIKGSKQQLLEQSSIMADKIDVAFEEGVHRIPACYYEFTKRYPDARGNLYNGFITSSADKIFESTNHYEDDKNG